MTPVEIIAEPTSKAQERHRVMLLLSSKSCATYQSGHLDLRRGVPDSHWA
jgi:hypothetical protein